MKQRWTAVLMGITACEDCVRSTLRNTSGVPCGVPRPSPQNSLNCYIGIGPLKRMTQTTERD